MGKLILGRNGELLSKTTGEWSVMGVKAAD